MKTRIDKLLVEKQFVRSRERAIRLIKKGGIWINGIQIKKPSYQADLNDNIEIREEDIKWVSRAGLKLEKAINFWKINLEGKVCLDVGASTGGFTDVLISKGATKVYAIDVGHDQLDKKLVKNKNVINLESTNIRSLDKKLIKELIDFVAIDVSFISLSLVIPEIVKFIKNNSRVVALIKPQFEVGKKNIGKGGIVKNPKLHNQAIEKVKKIVIKYNFTIKGVIESPISGSNGNKEFLIYLIFNKK